jgi:hypothetical protein
VIGVELWTGDQQSREVANVERGKGRTDLQAQARLETGNAMSSACLAPHLHNHYIMSLPRRERVCTCRVNAYAWVVAPPEYSKSPFLSWLQTGRAQSASMPMGAYLSRSHLILQLRAETSFNCLFVRNDRTRAKLGKDIASSRDLVLNIIMQNATQLTAGQSVDYLVATT